MVDSNSWTGLHTNKPKHVEEYSLLKLLFPPRIRFVLKDHHSKFHLMLSLGHLHYVALPNTASGWWCSFYLRTKWDKLKIRTENDGRN